MEQITDIWLSTAIICLGVYFVILFFQYAAQKAWVILPNKIVRGIIKWVGSMWLPLWPIMIGSVGVRYIPNIPLPKMILNLAPNPGITWTIYGAFCGFICTAVVKGIKHALEKKGIDLSASDLKIAHIEVAKAEENTPEATEKSEQPKKKKMKRIKKD